MIGANENRIVERLKMSFNKKNYGQLLTDTLPRVVETEEENERLLKIVEKLMSKGEENLSPEEDALLILLCNLIEDFEEEAYPIGNSTPADVLKVLLEDRGMKQKYLLPVFGSEGVISDILSGRRPITIKTAKKLAEFLGLSSYKVLV